MATLTKKLNKSLKIGRIFYFQQHKDAHETVMKFANGRKHEFALMILDQETEGVKFH